MGSENYFETDILMRFLLQPALTPLSCMLDSVCLPVEANDVG